MEDLRVEKRGSANRRARECATGWYGQISRPATLAQGSALRQQRTGVGSAGCEGMADDGTSACQSGARGGLFHFSIKRLLCRLRLVSTPVLSALRLRVLD